MYDYKKHTPEENMIKYFENQSIEALEETLTMLLNQDKIGGLDYIEILHEMFRRSYSKTNEIENLVKHLRISLERYHNEKRYKHYHCNETIIFTFRDKIKNNPNPSFDDIMCFVTCLDSFYSAGLNYDIDKSGVWKMTNFIEQNWSKNLKLYERINNKEVDARNIIDFCKALKTASNRNSYSFVTKFYHQFNNEYPIYDSKVAELLLLLFPEINVSVYKDYIAFYNVLNEVLLVNLNKHNLNMSVNEFDNAAWILIKEKQEKLKKEKGDWSLSFILK